MVLGYNLPNPDNAFGEMQQAAKNNQPTLALFYATKVIEEMLERLDELEGAAKASTSASKTSTTKRAATKTSQASKDKQAEE